MCFYILFGNYVGYNLIRMVNYKTFQTEPCTLESFIHNSIQHFFRISASVALKMNE